MKKIFTPQQKAAVALAAIKGDKIISQIASAYEVHPTQVQSWKKVLQEYTHVLFIDKRVIEGRAERQLIDELYETIGQRDIELSWLKKNCSLSHEQKVSLIEPSHPDISISCQTELFGISRSSLYYTPHPDPEEVRITRVIDEIYTQRSFYGSRRMKDALADDYTIHIGRHQIRRLIRLMGLGRFIRNSAPKSVFPNPRIRNIRKIPDPCKARSDDSR